MNYQQWYGKYVEGSDYVVKSVNNYRAINEKLAIKQAIKLIPNKYHNLLKDIKFDIITKGTSGVKGNTIYIVKGSDKYEVIHEIGHIMVDKLRINNDYKFINIINNTLHNLNKENIIFDPETFTKGIFRIESRKFVTEYQGRIYQTEGFTFGNGKLNYKAFRDYFPEGLRMYYQDKKMLKRKNLDLYNYIKELMSNGKNI
nr:MAG TPA_asm: PPEP-2, Metalloprotease, Zinc, HYDROLASE [Caudoviricetes sp.]